MQKRSSGDGWVVPLLLAVTVCAAVAALVCSIVRYSALHAERLALEENMILTRPNTNSTTGEMERLIQPTVCENVRFAVGLQNGSLIIETAGFLLAKAGLDPVALTCPDDAVIELYDAARGCLVYTYLGAEITVQQVPAGAASTDAVYTVKADDGRQMLLAQKQVSAAAGVLIIASAGEDGSRDRLVSHILQQYASAGLAADEFTAQVMGCDVNPRWFRNAVYHDGILSFCRGAQLITFSIYDGVLTGADFDGSLELTESLSVRYADLTDEHTGYRPYMIIANETTCKIMARGEQPLRELFCLDR